jgi:hypothetical protein
MHGTTNPKFIKPPLIAAYNEVLSQSASNKMKGIPFSNDRVERRISDMAEDTETKLTEKLKMEIIYITTGRIYKYSEQQHFTYVCTIY